MFRDPHRCCQACPLSSSAAPYSPTPPSSYTCTLASHPRAPILLSAIRTAAEEKAASDGNLDPDQHAITLSRSLVEPFLTFADRRDLREKAWRAWTKRGELDPARANQPIAEEILKLRRQQASLHGKPSFAHYQCEDMMAKEPQAVMSLLEQDRP